MLRRCSARLSNRPRMSGASAPVASRCLATSNASLLKTELHAFHTERGAKMVPYCGWEMPVQYTAGVKQEHLHTREQAGLFDVSHMGQLRFTGADRVRFVEGLVVGEIAELGEGGATLSLITNEQGGIKDDTIISSYADHLYVVINAGNADKDIAHFQEHLSHTNMDVQMEVLSDMSLVALQGPKAAEVLATLIPASVDLPRQAFMHGAFMDVAGIRCRVTRCGYTGEDGFEISVPSEMAQELATAILQNETALPIGLGARDSLRLEAGLCLYGNDINEGTTPMEAGLAWTVGKRRRQARDFIGADVIVEQILNKSHTRRRVGLVLEKGIARDHAPVFNAEGQEVGEVASGGYSPCLKKGVAMAWVQKAAGKTGTPLQVSVHKRMLPAVVSKMPWVPNNFYRGGGSQ